MYQHVSYKNLTDTMFLVEGWYSPDQYLVAYNTYINSTGHTWFIIDPLLSDANFINGLSQKNINMYYTYLKKFCDICTTQKIELVPGNCSTNPVQPANPSSSSSSSSSGQCTMNGMVKSTSAKISFALVSLICIFIVLFIVWLVCKKYNCSNQLTIIGLIVTGLIMGGAGAIIVCV